MFKEIKRIVKTNEQLFSILSSVKNYSYNKLNRTYKNIFSNIVGGNVIVKLKNIPGEYEMDIHSDILMRVLLKKQYEPRITELILENINPNKDVINIGANIGLYSNLLAANINIDRKVLAIEPTPNAFKLLKKNIQRNNNVDKTITFNGIATDKIGDYKINIVEGKEEYASVGKLIHKSIKNKKHISLKVKGATIDSLVEEHGISPKLIVIDVEGAEMNVFKGATNTLKNHNPIIITELDDELLSEQNSNSREVIKFLESLNYRIMDIEGGAPNFPFSGNIIARN